MYRGQFVCFRVARLFCSGASLSSAAGFPAAERYLLNALNGRAHPLFVAAINFPRGYLFSFCFSRSSAFVLFLATRPVVSLAGLHCRKFVA